MYHVFGTREEGFHVWYELYIISTSTSVWSGECFKIARRLLLPLVIVFGWPPKLGTHACKADTIGIM